MLFKKVQWTFTGGNNSSLTSDHFRLSGSLHEQIWSAIVIDITHSILELSVWSMYCAELVKNKDNIPNLSFLFKCLVSNESIFCANYQ